MVKESLRVGVKDMEKGDGSYKIRPVIINDDPLYSPLSPYENCKYCSVFEFFLFSERSWVYKNPRLLVDLIYSVWSLRAELRRQSLFHSFRRGEPFQQADSLETDLLHPSRTPQPGWMRPRGTFF